MGSSMGERLDQYLASHNISQAELARMAGVKQQTISYLINSKSRGSSYAVRIARALGVNPGWLQDGIGEPGDPMVSVSFEGGAERANWVPLVGSAEVLGVVDGERVEGPRVVTAVGVAPGSFAMQVDGRSMDPVFRNSDEVVVDVGLRPEPGEYVVALVGEVAVLRRYRPKGAKDPWNSFELIPENPDFPTIDSDMSPSRIVGVVVEHRRRLR